MNIEECIEWTLKLISQKESLQVYLTSYQKSTGKDRYDYESRFIKYIDLGSSISNEVISISGLLEKYIDDINRKLDKYDTKLGMNDFAGKCLIFSLSRSSAIDITDISYTHGIQILYMSHIEMKYLIGQQAFFRFSDTVLMQKEFKVYKSFVGIHENVEIV